MPGLLLIYQFVVLAGLVLSLAMVIANLSCFDALRPSPPPLAENAPRISVLVPARNEALNIGLCVSSLLSQDYPNLELIVLDDNSEDETLKMIQDLGLAETSTQHRLLRGAPLPAGWTGKNWACHQLAQAATGDFLFFTDADTCHAPGTVTASLSYAERKRADLLSAWPRLLSVTWGERLIIPMILFFGMVLYPHWLLRSLQAHPERAAGLPATLLRGLGAANGQFMFFRRAAYERIGGHAALRDHLVEDVGLGRAVASRLREGMRLFNCDSLGFSTTRMYRSFPEVWEGFTKNMRAAFEDSLVSFLMLGAIHVCGFLLPFAFLACGGAAARIAAAQLVVVLLIRIILTLRFRTSWWSAICHPLSEILMLAIGLNSWRRLASEGVTWKGRTYQAAEKG